MGILNLFSLLAVSDDKMYTMLLCITLTFFLVWYYGTMSYNYWNDKRIIHKKPFFPFIGNFKLSDLRKSNTDMIRALYERTSGEKYMGVYFFTTPVLFVREPEMIKRIMVSDFNNFVSRGFNSNPNDDPLSHNVLHYNYPIWKPLRTKLSPMFSKKCMVEMLDKIEILADKVVHQIGASTESKPFQSLDVTLRYAADMVTSTIFGENAGTLENKRNAFYTASSQIFTGYHFLIHVFCGFLFPKIHQFLKMNITKNFITKFYLKYSKELVNLSRSKKVNTEFMQILLTTLDEHINESKNYERKNNQQAIDVYNDNYAAGNIFMTFSAGYDSTGKISTFCLYEMAKNHVIQDRARREVKEVFSKYGNFSYKALSEMIYLDQIISEANRKYPILALIFRKCNERYKLPDGGELVPGDSIIIPTNSIHHDPDNYPEPQKFDPDRFSENNMKHHPATFLSFGIGPRMCPAWQFAPMVIKILLAKTLMKYKIKLHHSMKDTIEFKPRSFLLHPADEILIVKEDII